MEARQNNGVLAQRKEVYLPHISPISPQALETEADVSLYLAHISPISRPYLPRRSRRRRRPRPSRASSRWS